jgi:hypothetical protein
VKLRSVATARKASRSLKSFRAIVEYSSKPFPDCAV